MEVRRFEESMAEEWDDFLIRSANGTFLQSRAFLDIEGRSPSDHSLVLVEVQSGISTVVGVVPGHRVDAKFISHPGATHGGLIYLPRDGLERVTRLIAEIASALRAEAMEDWLVSPVPVPLRRVRTEADLCGYWRAGARLVGRGGGSFLPAGIPLGRRKNRRFARRAGVRCCVATSPESGFRLIEEVVMSRHHASTTHSQEQIRNLIRNFPDQIEMLEGWVGSQLVCAAITFRMPTCLHFQYMGATEAGRETQALDSLVEFASITATHLGLGLSFGVSTLKGGRVLNAGLAAFKEGFGALPMVHDTYEIAL